MSKSGKINVEQVRNFIELVEKEKVPAEMKDAFELYGEQFGRIFVERIKSSYSMDTIFELFMKILFCPEEVTVREAFDAILIANSSFKEMFTRDAYALLLEKYGE